MRTLDGGRVRGWKMSRRWQVREMKKLSLGQIRGQGMCK